MAAQGPQSVMLLGRLGAAPATKRRGPGLSEIAIPEEPAEAERARLALRRTGRRPCRRAGAPQRAGDSPPLAPPSGAAATRPPRASGSAAVVQLGELLDGKLEVPAAHGLTDVKQDPVKEARKAAQAVARQQRVVDKLTAEKDALMAKLKANKDATKKAEQELENLRELQRKRAIAAGRIRSAKQKAQREKQAAREEKKQARAHATLKASKKRLDGMRGALSAARSKAESATDAYKRATQAFEQAKKRCKELRESGEHVPEEGEKDISAPGAWKPPGLQAAKARDAAKVVFIKTKAAWEKAQAIFDAKESRQKAIKEKMQEVKTTQLGEDSAPAKVAKKPAAK